MLMMLLPANVLTMSFLLDFREKSANSESSSSCFRCSAWEEKINTHEPCKYDSQDTRQQQCLSTAVSGQGDSLAGTEGLQETWAAGPTAERRCQSERQELPWSRSAAGEESWREFGLPTVLLGSSFKKACYCCYHCYWVREISGLFWLMVYEH